MDLQPACPPLFTLARKLYFSTIRAHTSNGKCEVRKHMHKHQLVSSYYRVIMLLPPVHVSLNLNHIKLK